MKGTVTISFDTETSCGGKEAEIIQLAVQTKKGQTFSRFVLPKKGNPLVPFFGKQGLYYLDAWQVYNWVRRGWWDNKEGQNSGFGRRNCRVVKAN